MTTSVADSGADVPAASGTRGETRIGGSALGALIRAIGTEVPECTRADMTEGPGSYLVQSSAGPADATGTTSISVDAAFVYPSSVASTADRLRSHLRTRLHALAGVGDVQIRVVITALVAAPEREEMT